MDSQAPWWVARGLAEVMLTAGYELEELIGRGGMAVVFRAHDVRLNRTVALKIVAPEHAADESYKTRFISESRTAAAVDHPNIIPIYEAGEVSDVLFIAMRFAGGGDVSALARDRPVSAARATELIRQAASALDQAHARGLVHRDIKPENMLLDAGGDDDRPDHVYLSDFGLSKEMLRASGPTPSGLFVGTMDYISPEQIEGRPLDGRADQYSLGCSAFKLLSGLPPYRRNSGPAIIAAHLWAELPLLSSLRPELGSAVDQVFLKVLAKSPDDRYRTCSQFARALTEALAGAAVQADPALAPPPAELRAPTGYPEPVALSRPGPDRGRLSGQLTMTAPGMSAPRPPDPPPPARSGRILIGAAAGLIVLAGALGLLHVLTGWPAAAKPKPAAGSTRHKGSGDSLSSQRATAASKHRRSPSPSTTPSAPAIGTAPAPQNSAPATTPVDSFAPAGAPGINAVAFSPNGTLAAGGADGSTTLWDPATGEPIRTLADTASKEVTAVAFSPDGHTLATADANHEFYLWSTATGHLIDAITDPQSQGVLAVAFSPDGQLIATGDQNHHLYLWNATTHALIKTITEPDSQGVNTLAFSPDGHLLAAGDYNHDTYLWSIPSGAAVAQFAATNAVDSVTFSPDGQLLAAGSYDGSTYLYEVSSRSLVATLPDPGVQPGVESIAFSPDGQTLAVGDHDGSTYLWNVSRRAVTGTLTTSPYSGPARVWAVAFSPDGQLLATGDHAGVTDLWKVG
jgi:eukaryotic-like serine/threonine-protein kinase